MTIDVVFLDSGRDPTEKTNPDFPDGVLVNLAPHALAKTCTRNVPYPAPRFGVYSITCRKCKLNVAITVAGRTDDPNAVTLPCKTGGLDA
jgi:hypothetical protein